MLDLEGLPGGIEQDGGRTELAHGMDGDDELRTIGRHDDDAVAPSDTLAGEVLREGVPGPVEVPECPGVLPRQHCRTLREAGSRRLEPAMHEARSHGETFFSDLRSTSTSAKGMVIAVRKPLPARRVHIRAGVPPAAGRG